MDNGETNGQFTTMIPRREKQIQDLEHPFSVSSNKSIFCVFLPIQGLGNMGALKVNLFWVCNLLLWDLFCYYLNSIQHFQILVLCSSIFLEYLTYQNKVPEIGCQIAGVRKGNVFGMMPHPERGCSTEFKKILLNLLHKTKDSIENNIKNLLHSEHISYKSTRKYLSKLHTSSLDNILL